MKNTLLLMALGAGQMSATAQTTLNHTVYFDSDKSELNASEVESLNTFLTDMDHDRITSIEMTGHTDSIGSDSYNNELSFRRVEHVKSVANHLDLINIQGQATWKGEHKPTSPELASNRRVELTVHLKDAEIPHAFMPPTQTFTINPNRDTILSVGNCGSQIVIPSGSFVTTEHTKVQKPLVLKYTEYNTSADMAFSGIKMKYKDGNGEYNFNSSGMFDLRGEGLNGEEVLMASNGNVTMNYCLAKQNEDIDFYHLKNDKEWVLQQEIQEEEIVEMDSVVGADVAPMADGRWMGGRGGWIDNRSKFARALGLCDGKGRFALIKINGLTPATGGGQIVYQPDPGHTYPDIVQGLRLSGFGVYNCDQTYRLTERIDIIAQYRTEDRKPIEDVTVLSMIDLKYNGAFSYDPKRFSCSASGDNVLMVFTKSGKIYMLGKGEFDNLNIQKSGSYTFTMMDVTEKFKSTEDLESYLRS